MIIADDPFAILGVPREASPAEVKRAYRRLAMLWHPDRNRTAAAEAEFRRVQAAYELLLDPQRMAEWQQAQAAGPASESSPPDEAAGDDLTQALTLTLEEAALGCRKDIDLVHGVRCASCRSSGRVEHRHSVPCQRCSGCGRTARRGGGTSVCTGCAGRGYLRETECTDCSGTGWREESRTLSVSVPPGLVDGERLRLARQAPTKPGGNGGRPGDLYLEIRLAAHPLFTLRGRDLYCEVPVSIYRRLCGGQIEVPTLSGTTTLELSPYPEQSPEYRLPGLGFPHKRRQTAGDLVLQLQRIYPESVRPKDIELLERLELRLASDLEKRAPQLAAWEARMRQRRNAGGG